MHYNKVSFLELLHCFDNDFEYNLENAWNLEHNAVENNAKNYEHNYLSPSVILIKHPSCSFRVPQTPACLRDYRPPALWIRPW